MLNFRRRNQPSPAPQHEYDTEIEVNNINVDENDEQDEPAALLDSRARFRKAVQERWVSAVSSCVVSLLSRRRRRRRKSASGCARIIQTRYLIRTIIAVLILILWIMIGGSSNTTTTISSSILRPLMKDLRQLQFFHFLCRSITWYIQQDTQDNNHNNNNDTALTALWRGTVPNKQIYRTSNNNNNNINNNINIDVVISHYYCGDNDEDDDAAADALQLQWIFGDWSQPLLFRKVFLFLKCEHARTADEELATIATLVQRYDGILPTQTKIIHLNPNVGRCDHTYAHYLANYYFYNEHSNQNNHQNNQNNQNPNTSTPAGVTRFAAEYILFVKDNNNSHREHYSRHKSLREMLAMSAEWGFACHEETNWIWSPSTAHAETNSKATSKSSSSSFITEISYYHDWERLQQYTVHDSYARLARDTTTDFHNPTQYPTLGRYAHHMQIQIPHESSSITDNNNTNTNSNNSSARTTYRRLVPVCYGGNFLFHSGGNSGSASRTASADGTTTTNSMVTEESNTKVPRYHQWYYHSQQFWKRIEVSLSRSNNIIEGHYMERLWGAILARPLSVETTNKLLHYQEQSHTSKRRHRHQEKEGECLADTNHWGALCK